MKKTYIIPTLLITSVHTERLIAESLNLNATGSDGDVLVKDNRASETSSSYNVWNDDWSE